MLTILRAFLVIAPTILPIGLKAQPDTLWSLVIGGDRWEEGYDVQQTLDGGFIVVGFKQNPENLDDRDIWLIKTDASGDTLWTKTFGESGFDIGYSVVETADSGFVIAGRLGNNFFLIRTNELGDMVWANSYGAGGATDVNQLQDGGFIAVGGVLGDIKLLRISSTGEIIWEVSYGLSPDSDYSFDLTLGSGNEIYVTGWFSTSEGGIFLMRVDSTGQIIWSQTYDMSHGPRFQQTSDGGFVISSYTGGSWWGGPKSKVRVLRTNSIGDTLWTRTYDFDDYYDWYSTDILQMPDGGYAIAARADCCGDVIYGQSATLIRIDSLGNTLWVLWLADFGGDENISGINSISLTADKGLILVGQSWNSSTREDFWLLRLSPNEASLGVPEMPEQPPLSFQLFNNYPNPFNPTTRLEFYLPQQVDVSLKVYDIMGREVMTIANESMNAGYHRMNWNGRDKRGQQVPSGIFIAILVTPEYSRSIKMVLLK